MTVWLACCAIGGRSRLCLRPGVLGEEGAATKIGGCWRAVCPSPTTSGTSGTFSETPAPVSSSVSFTMPGCGPSPTRSCGRRGIPRSGARRAGGRALVSLDHGVEAFDVSTASVERRVIRPTGRVPCDRRRHARNGRDAFAAPRLPVWPFTRGRGWLLRLARLAVGGRAVRFDIGGGTAIEGRLDDWMTLWTFMCLHERDEAFQRSLALARSAGVIFDVGAHAGIWSLLAAHQNPDARIHAFEPVPATVERLRDHAAINASTGMVITTKRRRRPRRRWSVLFPAGPQYRRVVVLPAGCRRRRNPRARRDARRLCRARTYRCGGRDQSGRGRRGDPRVFRRTHAAVGDSGARRLLRVARGSVRELRRDRTRRQAASGRLWLRIYRWRHGVSRVWTSRNPTARKTCSPLKPHHLMLPREDRLRSSSRHNHAEFLREASTARSTRPGSARVSS